jgi:Zn-dependent peptidase ImmA (M78 family)
LEEQAYRFAAELLTPVGEVSLDFNSERINLFRLASLKRQWQVSMQALARRARDLEAISDRQYRYLMQQMSMKGWRMEEPVFSAQQIEMPRLIQKLTEVAFGQTPDMKKMATEFHLTKDFLAGVLKTNSTGSRKSVIKKSDDRARILSFVGKGQE